MLSHAMPLAPELPPLIRFGLILPNPGYGASTNGIIWTCRSNSQHGRFRDAWSPMRPSVKKCGHLQVTLCFKCKFRYASVHTLILETFIGPCPPGMQACHFPDRDPTNNHVNNLRWDTCLANHHDRDLHGTTARGRRNANAALDEESVRDIRKNYRYGDSSFSIGAFAKKYGVSRPSIHAVIQRKAWGHLPD